MYGFLGDSKNNKIPRNCRKADTSLAVTDLCFDNNN